MIIHEKEKICPYTGLRSFTEEESVYFRGRDEQIEKLTLQLGRSKFLMVTGASGDGKSSIIYAGMIPYLKAGFLKTDYTRWAVADFRPERDPLGNFVRALSRNFDNVSSATLRTELSRGFSSLIMLYKNSPLYVDPRRKEWVNGTEAERKVIRRDAGNLFILVDQFEEFFTNPENYRQGMASEEASLVVSTLLETARIALKEDLPIYIVFTMRSDYIGQCVAFRGMPEFIGFSQFFIPRLNREEIKTVIREPAEFSGFEIADRLVERILYDLEEGIDQLPILQHTLSRIWHFASGGNKPMDLIHYAMAGGLSANELSAEDRETFEMFLTSIPVEVRGGYDRPGLRNVLDLHANTLYNDAYQATHGLDKKSIATIIQTTFKCLTRIDEERAVRNRMTLKEITHIIDRPDISAQKVAAVLKVFREPGTTFLKPYIDATQEKTEVLLPNDVLDITHESLIRNWRNLEDWAKQEHKHYKVYQELRNVLNHWIVNEFSSNFLLSVGALNYFEEWKDQSKPNAYWIHRYEKLIDPETSMEESQLRLVHINQFLRKSAWKNIVSRTVLRYGMQNLIAVFASVFLVISCSIFFIESRLNRNQGVVNRIKAEGMKLLSSPMVADEEKGIFLIALYREDSSRFFQVMESLRESKVKLAYYQSVIANLNMADTDFHGYLMRYVFRECQKEIDSLRAQVRTDPDRVVLIEQIHRLSMVAYCKASFNYHPEFKTAATNLSTISYNALIQLLESPERYNKSGLNLKYAFANIDGMLGLKAISREQVTKLLQQISIFETPHCKAFAFYSGFPSTVKIENGETLQKGIFQLLGHLYAFSGSVKNVQRCYDSLRANNNSYFANTDPTVPPNASAFSLTINFLLNGWRTEFETVNKYIAQKEKKPLHNFYNDLIEKSNFRWFSRQSYFAWGSDYRMLTLDDFDDQYLKEIYSIAVAEADKANVSGDQRNFMKAMLSKKLGLHLAAYYYDKSIPIDTASIYLLFNNAFDYFNRLPKSFLDKAESFLEYDFSKNEWGNINFSNHQIFVYPSFYKSYMFGHFRTFCTEIFFRYIVDRKIQSVYAGKGAVEMLGRWFINVAEMQLENPGRERLKPDFYPKANEIVVTSENDTSQLYPVLIKIIVVNTATRSGQQSDVQITQNDVSKLLKAYRNGQPRWSSGFDDLLMHNLKKYLETRIQKQGIDVLQSYVLSNDYGFRDYQLVKLILNIPVSLHDNKSYENFYTVLDSGYSLLNRYRTNTKEQQNNPELEAIESLMRVDDYVMDEIAFNVVKESDDQYTKVVAYRKQVTAIMASGDYFNAMRAVPNSLSSTYNMIFYRRVLDDFRKKKQGDLQDKEWKVFDEAYKTNRFL